MSIYEKDILDLFACLESELTQEFEEVKGLLATKTHRPPYLTHGAVVHTETVSYCHSASFESLTEAFMELMGSKANFISSEKQILISRPGAEIPNIEPAPVMKSSETTTLDENLDPVVLFGKLLGIYNRGTEYSTDTVFHLLATAIGETSEINS